MNYKIYIEDETFDLDASSILNFDIIEMDKGQFHLLHQHQAYQIRLIQTNFKNKTLSLDINGNQYDVKIKDEYDQLIEQMGLGLGSAKKIKDIKAPMPGLILDLLVKDGQKVSKGDQLLILEAMKMENVIKAEGEGVIKSIEVKKEWQ